MILQRLPPESGRRLVAAQLTTKSWSRAAFQRSKVRLSCFVKDLGAVVSNRPTPFPGWFLASGRLESRRKRASDARLRSLAGRGTLRVESTESRSRRFFFAGGRPARRVPVRHRRGRAPNGDFLTSCSRLLPPAASP